MIRSVLAGAAAVLVLTLCACSLPLQIAPETDLSETYPEITTQPETQSETQTQTEVQTQAPSEAFSEVPAEDVSGPTGEGTAILQVQWLQDTELEEGNYDAFEAEIDPQTQIVFTTDQTVRDVRILSLFANGANDDGSLQFDQTVLYRQSTFTPDRPLVIATTFFGDLPNNGISYTDANGTEKRFAVGISGEDGSLLLLPF